MQRITGGDADFKPQALGQQVIHTRQVEQREFPGRIVIDKDIEIAVWAVIAARARAVDIERGGAFSPDGIDAIIQAAEQFVAFHVSRIAGIRGNCHSSAHGEVNGRENGTRPFFLLRKPRVRG